MAKFEKFNKAACPKCNTGWNEQKLDYQLASIGVPHEWLSVICKRCGHRRQMLTKDANQNLKRIYE